MIKRQLPGSFVGVDVSRRMRKSEFFHQLNAVIDWAVFERARYKVCNRSIQDAAGRTAYHPLALFNWYHLSGMGAEEMVNDTTSANAFGGLRVEDTMPDHSTFSHFRNALSAKRIMVFWCNKKAAS